VVGGVAATALPPLWCCCAAFPPRLCSCWCSWRCCRDCSSSWCGCWFLRRRRRRWCCDISSPCPLLPFSQLPLLPLLITPSLCINNLFCFLTFFPCLSLFSFFFSKGFPTLCFFLPTLPNYPSCLPPFLFLFHVLLPSPFPSCSSLLYSPLNSSWRGCWDEENDELAMAFFPLFLFLLLLCFLVGCCFVAPLEEKELLRRKWLLLLWASVEASLKRSCWIVGRIWWCWEEADDASRWS